MRKYTKTSKKCKSPFGGIAANLFNSKLVIGYHATDLSVAEKILARELQLNPSQNKYDWLGHGVYFWQDDPIRAYEFALEQIERGKFHDPAVIGAYIRLGDCFDLHYRENTQFLAEALARCEQLFQDTKNSGKKHDLDCLAINFAVAYLEKHHGRKIDSVRGYFQEGAPIFPGSAIYQASHIQICIRNPKCIVGYFQPSELTLP